MCPSMQEEKIKWNENFLDRLMVKTRASSRKQLKTGMILDYNSVAHPQMWITEMEENQ